MRSDGLYSNYKNLEVRISNQLGTNLITLISHAQESLDLGFKRYEETIFIKEDVSPDELGECFKVRNYATYEGHESMFSGPDKKGLIWIDTRDKEFAQHHEHILYERSTYRVGVPMDKCTFREEIIPYTF